MDFMSRDIDNFASVDPSELATRAPFSTLFPVRRELREKIAHSMREGGFDPSKPINVWRQENVVVDGHTRLSAAADAGVEVFVCFHDFKDEDEAMDYAIANQRDRRNLTDAELASLVLAIDARKKHGRPSKEMVSTDTISGRTRERTAEITGTSPRKVSKIRAIADYANNTGDRKELENVLAGRDSINLAERSIQVKKQEAVSEKVGQAVAWIEEHGNDPIGQMIEESGLSRGTLHAARVHLGLAEPSKKKSRKEIEQKSYQSVAITNGHSTPLEIRLMERPVEAIDEVWLASLPARGLLSCHDKFDSDALIVRHCKPRLQEIKGEIERLIGLRSQGGMTPLHRALHRVFDIADPGSWRPCNSCKSGTPGKSQTCRECNGTGYVIPNFTKGSD